MYENLAITGDDGTTNYYNLGNSVQNASTHRINSQLNMRTFYNYIGLRKKKPDANRGNQQGGGSNQRRNANDARTGRDNRSAQGPETVQTASLNRSDAVSREGLNSMSGGSRGGSGSGLSAGQKTYNVFVD